MYGNRGVWGPWNFLWIKDSWNQVVFKLKAIASDILQKKLGTNGRIPKFHPLNPMKKLSISGDQQISPFSWCCLCHWLVSTNVRRDCGLQQRWLTILSEEQEYKTYGLDPIFWETLYLKGQGRVYPLNVRVPMLFSWCSRMGFLGIITRKYPLSRAYVTTSHRGTLVGVHPTIPWISFGQGGQKWISWSYFSWFSIGERCISLLNGKSFWKFIVFDAPFAQNSPAEKLGYIIYI